MPIGDEQWLEEQQAQIQAALAQQQRPMPTGTPDDGTGSSWTGLLGQVLGGGQTSGHRLRGREADTAGNRALLNFGINMLLASGPQRVRPDFLSAAATGLQGAQQSIDADQQRAGALAKDAREERRLQFQERIGTIGAATKLAELQQTLRTLRLRQEGLDGPGAGGGAAGAGAPPAAGAPGGGAGALQLTGDLEKDRPIIKQRESGGDPTALNYVARADPTAYARGATAGGLYGFTNTTWREGLQMIGGDAGKYPEARKAPPEVQDAVFTAVYRARGTAPWDPTKWGQNWIRGADGKYNLVATPAGGGGTPTPPPYRVAGQTQPPPGQTPPAAVAPATPPGVTPPPATPQATPPATPAVPGAQPAAAVVTPPADLPPGVQDYQTYRQTNLRQPSPEDRALFGGELTLEDKQGIQTERGQLEQALRNAQTAYRQGTAEAGVVVAARTKLAEHEGKVREAAAAAREKGREREAKWWENQETQLRTQHGALLKDALTHRNAVELETLRAGNKRQENVDTAVTGAASERVKELQGRAGVAQRMIRNVEALEAFAPAMGDPNALVSSNPQLRDWLITLGMPGLAGATMGELRASQVWDRLVTSFAGDVKVPSSGSTSDKEGEWMMSQFGGPEQTIEDRMTQLSIIRKLSANRIADHTDAADMFQSQNGKLSGLDKKIAERSKLFDRPPTWKAEDGGNLKAQGRYMMRHPRGEPYAAYNVNGELRYYRNEMVTDPNTGKSRLEPRPLLGGSMVAE